MTKLRSYTLWTAIGLPLSVVLGTVIGTPHTFGDIILYQKILINMSLGVIVWIYLFFITQWLDRKMPWSSSINWKRWLIQLVITLPIVLLITWQIVIWRNAWLDYPFSPHLFIYTDVPLISLLSIIIMILFQRQSHKETISNSDRNDVIFQVKVGSTSHRVEEDEIAYLFRKNELNYLKKWNDSTIVLDEALTTYEDLLSGEFFFKVNRKFIAHKKAIKSYKVLASRQIKITLDPPTSEEVLLNKNRLSAFKQWLGH